MSSPEPEYDVALSFAGEQRGYVKAVASELNKHGVRVFYDEDNEIALWGKNLAEELQRIYMAASNVVVMFVSADYARKSWPIHERQSAIGRAINERREYILPVRFDNTALPGLDPSLSYLSLAARPPAKLAENIMAKLVQLGGRIEPAKPEFRAHGDSEGKFRVVVHNEHGQPVEGASILLVAQNGTSTQGTTGADGAADMSAAVCRKVAVFVAHPQHRAGLYREHDNGAALEVTLPAGNGVHSIIFASETGHIPKLGCRLAPIGDAHDAEGIPRRTYMYVTNGSVDGRAEQPFFFTVGRPMMLENSEGLQVRATCVGFVGRFTLWEYEYPRSDDLSG
jgi:hypothetical protein